MAQITYITSNGSDTAFTIHGVGFGSTQATYTGVVAVENTGGAYSNASVSSWSDGQINATMPADHAPVTGKVHVLVKIRDFGGAYHPVPSNELKYTLS